MYGIYLSLDAYAIGVCGAISASRLQDRGLLNISFVLCCMHILFNVAMYVHICISTIVYICGYVDVYVYMFMHGIVDTD